jgi:ribosomal protein S18 acetylase RimI-like enzyme
MHVMNCVLRQATPADAADLSAFAERVFVETFGKDNTPDDMQAYLRSAFSTELQAQEIADPDALMLLACVPNHDIESHERETLAAYAYLTRGDVPSVVGDAEALELRRFYVAGEWQGRGLANTLMHEVKRQATARGARTLWLGVWEHNARAIAFYRKHGFREVGSHPFLLGRDLQTDLEMAASLDATP